MLNRYVVLLGALCVLLLSPRFSEPFQGQIDFVSVLLVLGVLLMSDMTARHLMIVRFDRAEMIHRGVGEIGLRCLRFALSLIGIGLGLAGVLLCSFRLGFCFRHLGLDLGKLELFGSLGFLLLFLLCGLLLLHLRRRWLTRGLLAFHFIGL